MHKTFAIDKLVSEAGGQPSRLTNQPHILHGRALRAGGISPREDVTWNNHGDFANLDGFDWLGFSAWHGANTRLYYNQDTGGVAVYPPPAREWIFWPGGAVGELPTSSVPYTADYYWGNVGRWCSARNAGTDYVFDFSISENTLYTSGGWQRGNCVTALAVLFAPTAYGWVAIDWKVSSLRITSDGSKIEVYYYIQNNSCPSCDLRIKIYIAWVCGTNGGATPGCQNGNTPGGDDCDSPFFSQSLWYPLYDKIWQGGESWFVSRSGSGREGIGEPSEMPWFYLGISEQINYYSKYGTYSKDRNFFINRGELALRNVVGIEYRCHGACDGEPGYQIRRYTCTSNRRVWFTDVGFLNFSSAAIPNHFEIDDVAQAITPSTRGVYIASSHALYEAYGDFVSASTRIDRIPIGFGVSAHIPHSVAYSGRDAFFVKDGRVYAVGVGGLRDIYMPEADGHQVFHVYYDRHSDQLLISRALFDERHDVVAYDSRTGTIQSFSESYREPIVLSIVSYGSERTTPEFGSISSAFGSYDIILRKVDMGLPSIRKRVHIIHIPYDGDYVALPEVSIRRSGTLLWQACTVNDRGGYFEVRCPSIVDRAFDVRIRSTAPTNPRRFAINPPIIFVYEPREPSYANR